MLGIVGIGIFRQRRESATLASSEQPTEPFSSPSPPRASFVRSPLPFEVPDPSGECHFLKLPDELLSCIFVKLDRPELSRCFRLCKSLHTFLTESAAINLQLTLMGNSLLLNPLATRVRTDNPRQVPLTSAAMLSTLRERITRMRNLAPRSITPLTLMEPEGRLYEYIEGVLLRGVGGRSRELPNEMAVYDLRQLNDWEDSEEKVDDEEAVETEEEAGLDCRRAHKFPFKISEFAVDPGQDLLVVVELRLKSRSERSDPQLPYSMYFHLLTLSTFERHPRAREPVVLWPFSVLDTKISLSFQICDDGLFVLYHNKPSTLDLLVGWQWTTGRLAVSIRAERTMSFQSLILLTPSSFLIPTVVTRIDMDAETADQLDNWSDLYWTHHLQLYAFPPFSSMQDNSPPNKATHVATIDLPSFHTDIARNIPPPVLTARTDPPPRHTFPTHPLHAPAPLQPDPESGAMIIEVWCQNEVITDPHPHFAICTLKKTLLRYLPAPTSPLLTQPFSRPAPVISWDKIAPDVRMFGPDLEEPQWVCYVYHNRWVSISKRIENGEEHIGLDMYDFDPLRNRKERLDRLHQLEQPDGDVGGDVDGIELVEAETVLEAVRPLTSVIKTGSNLPYMRVSRPTDAEGVLIDSDRVIALMRPHPGRSSRYDAIEIMEF